MIVSAQTTFYTTTQTPLGDLWLTAEADALTGLYFTPASIAENVLRSDTAAPFASAKQQLAEYFAGKRQRFELPLKPAGTEYQRMVWEELSCIPYGETITYGEQTRRLNLPPESVRSIGTVNGQNPLCILTPCHRVIGANGKLTGYSGGLERKQRLLELESLVRRLFA